MDTLIEQGYILFEEEVAHNRQSGHCPLPYVKIDGEQTDLLCDCPKTKTYLITQLGDSFPSCISIVKCPVRQYLFESKQK